MRKHDKVSARLSSLPKYSRTVAEKARKPLVFMYHQAMSIFLVPKSGLNFVFFSVFQTFAVLVMG